MTRFQLLRRYAEALRAMDYQFWRLVREPIRNAIWHFTNRDTSRYCREFRRNLERDGKWTIQA